MMEFEDLSETVESLAPGSQFELAPFVVGSPSALNAAVIVAHPDDETLWAGGTILMHPSYRWFIVATCRKNDPDRSPKFYRVLQNYGAMGVMADLDDSPEQIPLRSQDVQETILQLLPPLTFDLLLTHAPGGEYTRHRRHEEVSQAVLALWQTGQISAKELRLFAYEDDGGRRLPQAIQAAHHYVALPDAVWQEKYRLITEIYGFSPQSWEARTTPRSEAFWRFESEPALQAWLDETRVTR
jgi:LmbE family N-acetylglucosaminyl deacetylase